MPNDLLLFHGFTWLLFIMLVFYMVTVLRKPPKKKPRYIESFEVEAPPEVILEAIAYFGMKKNMDIDFFDENERRITLGDRLNLFSGAFFYPIYLTTEENGATLVEVGVKGKASITGSAAFRYRDKVVQGIKAAIFMKSHSRGLV